MNIDLIKALGTYWEKDGKVRFYFNDLNKLLGLRLKLHDNGKIHRAYLKGQLISVRQANELDCRNKKIYYDPERHCMRDCDEVNPDALVMIIKLFS
jgi:hypothetical protein